MGKTRLLFPVRLKIWQSFTISHTFEELHKQMETNQIELIRHASRIQLETIPVPDLPHLRKLKNISNKMDFGDLKCYQNNQYPCCPQTTNWKKIYFNPLISNKVEKKHHVSKKE